MDFSDASTVQAFVVAGAGVLGALLGGVASAWGARSAARGQHQRELRVEIYRRRLPEVRQSDGALHKSVAWKPTSSGGAWMVAQHQPWDELVRAALAAGGRDARFGQKIEENLEAWRKLPLDGGGVDARGRKRATAEETERWEKQRAELEAAVEAYEGYLRRKLR